MRLRAASAQRQGVGRALMSAVARDLLARGHASATLWVLEGNGSARRFYEALGGRQSRDARNTVTASALLASPMGGRI